MRLVVLTLSAVVVALLGTLIVVPSAQIVMRSLFGLPFIGAEELTRFLLICLVFIAYPLVVEAGENIVMGEFGGPCHDQSAPPSMLQSPCLRS